MKTYAKSLIILIVGFMLISCEKNDIETPQYDIMPLETGNYWKYIAYDFEEETQSVLIDSIGTDTIMNGEKWFILKGTNAFFSNRNNGLWDRVGLYPEELLMKYPAKAGDSWVISRPGLPIEVKVYVVSIDALVEIDNQVYECYEYEFYENGMLKRKVFASPSIGRVKTEVYKSTANDTVKLVREYILVEYSLN